MSSGVTAQAIGLRWISWTDGFAPAASVGAVLVYHAIAIWVPGLGGLVAWLPTRGRGLSKAAGVPLPEPAAQPVTLSG